jgi:DNA helicase II / ATP-dependent DNA helicase PcrA
LALDSFGEARAHHFRFLFARKSANLHKEMATLFDLEPREGDALKHASTLNEAQKRAIMHGEGPLLVIAGAGTGKTRVITERIHHLLQTDHSLSCENILALTFTKKAAGEMKSRVVKAVGARGKNVTLATFHSFCETLLKDADPALTPLEEVDQWIVLRRNLARLRLEKFRRLAEPGQFLSDFIKFFSRCQDELVSSEDYQAYVDGLAHQLEAERDAMDEETYRERAEHVALQQEIARAYRASEELLREKRAVALNGLIPQAIGLLQQNEGLRTRLQTRFRHILVDEFQDTNIAQLELLYLLAAEPRNVVVVGDNDQAIYRFRGASFGSFKLFLERFAGWRAGQDSTRFRVTLTENYRSVPNILRVATQVIAQNEVSADFPKKILYATKPEGERIRIAELPTAEDEAPWVASELERLHGAGHRWKDFAVLYRQHAHRDSLVEELAKRKIPFVISRLSILEHPLVRDVLAYLRLIAKPFDDIACARVLAAPAWHLEAGELVRLAERAGRKRALYNLLQDPQTHLPFDASHGALAELLRYLEEQRKNVNRHAAREILSDLLEWLEIPRRIAAQDQKYINRLGEFEKDWEQKSETRGLAEFLEYLDYFDQAGGTLSLEDDIPGDAVQLMTVHGAKGLEFPHVFLLRVNNRAFPATERAPLFEFPTALMKEELPAGQFHIQEERRLFYVALTRAQQRLTITTLTEKNGKVPVFIEDILMDPAVKRRDVWQLAPRVNRGKAVSREKTKQAEADLLLFPVSTGLPKVFSRIVDWAEAFHPKLPEPLKLSASAVENYRKCPQRFLFGYLWSLKEGPRGNLSFGSVMHTTIKRFIEQLRRGVTLPFEEVARIFETEWSSAGFEDTYQEAEYKKDGLEQLRTFHATILESPPNVLEQEKAFELPLENNVIVKGRIDQINSLGRKDVEIVDYKTGNPKKEAAAQRDLQLSIYALAAQEILELNPVRLLFHHLQNNQVQATTRGAKQLEEAQNIVLEAAGDIRAGQFPAKAGFICRSCAYRPICPAHEEALSV